MSQEGSCLCGKIRVSYTGSPAKELVCHCMDCRKVTGSAFSCNALIKGDDYKVLQGTPKEYTKKADSGSTITSYFCGDCGSTLWRESESFPGLNIVKMGTMDDDQALARMKPDTEFFSRNRVGWVPELPGTHQAETQ